MTLRQAVHKKIPTFPLFQSLAAFPFYWKTSSATWFKFFYTLIFLLYFFFKIMMLNLTTGINKGISLSKYICIHTKHAVFDSCLLHLFHLICYHPHCIIFVVGSMSFRSYLHLQFKFDQSLE